MIRIYALDTTRHIGTIKVSNGQSTEEQYLNSLILLQLAPVSPMGNSIINWIEQWLNDRRQRVVVDGEVSSWKPVLGGVPQGYVLGPILFLVYINNFHAS